MATKYDKKKAQQRLQQAGSEDLLNVMGLEQAEDASVIARLRAKGVHVIEPLTLGEIVSGRMAAPGSA